MKIFELDTPSLLIDEDIMKSNMAFMQEYADANGVSLRPHTKTHKTPAIAKTAIEAGAKGIAVAKVGEAEVMAENGLDDIFIANEIASPAKMERIRKLAEKIEISFGADCVEQLEMAEQVFEGAGKPAEVLIEIEVGEERSGVIEKGRFLEILSFLERSKNVRLKGVFSHDGNTYKAKDMEELLSISAGAQKRTLEFAALARSRGFECPVVSYGATPTFMNRVPILEGITELRPGTYVFMDASQGNAIGTLDRCAATVLASVMSRPTPERVVLDVGAKGLTMQTRTQGICAVKGLGMIKEYPGVHIDRMNDEHAVIENRAFHDAVRVGDKLRVIPVHICPVCNLYDSLYLVRGDEVIAELPIACRGKMK
ncbi:MAG: D-TA family PLP-dependent enzyme [Firmicutes bacterium]|nr:D-TA family PLP-dependent enzyme [Bacillota bacterium]